MRRYLGCALKVRTHCHWRLWTWSLSHSINKTSDWKINLSRVSDHREVTSGLEILQMQKAGRDFSAGMAACFPTLTLYCRHFPSACQGSWLEGPLVWQWGCFVYLFVLVLRLTAWYLSDCYQKSLRCPCNVETLPETARDGWAHGWGTATLLPS